MQLSIDFCLLHLNKWIEYTLKHQMLSLKEKSASKKRNNNYIAINYIVWFENYSIEQIICLLVEEGKFDRSIASYISQHTIKMELKQKKKHTKFKWHKDASRKAFKYNSFLFNSAFIWYFAVFLYCMLMQNVFTQTIARGPWIFKRKYSTHFFAWVSSSWIKLCGWYQSLMVYGAFLFTTGIFISLLIVHTQQKYSFHFDLYSALLHCKKPYVLQQQQNAAYTQRSMLVISCVCF